MKYIYFVSFTMEFMSRVNNETVTTSQRTEISLTEPLTTIGQVSELEERIRVEINAKAHPRILFYQLLRTEPTD